jgi:hypothetical protein
LICSQSLLRPFSESPLGFAEYFSKEKPEKRKQIILAGKGESQKETE